MRNERNEQRGLNALLGARAAGASQILAIDTSGEKLRLVRDKGTTEMYDAHHPGCIAKAKEFTKGGVNCAFEMPGPVAAVEIAYRVTQRGGKTATSGIPHSSRVWPNQHASLVTEERTVRGIDFGSAEIPGAIRDARGALADSTR